LREYLEETVFPELPDEVITQMSSMLASASDLFTAVHELPYLQPEELAWQMAWERAINDFSDVLDITTQINPIL
jgi:hypothetical protein